MRTAARLPTKGVSSEAPPISLLDARYEMSAAESWIRRHSVSCKWATARFCPEGVSRKGRGAAGEQLVGCRARGVPWHPGVGPEWLF
jgi:hypothetical protein